MSCNCSNEICEEQIWIPPCDECNDCVSVGLADISESIDKLGKALSDSERIDSLEMVVNNISVSVAELSSKVNIILAKIGE